MAVEVARPGGISRERSLTASDRHGASAPAWNNQTSFLRKTGRSRENAAAQAAASLGRRDGGHQVVGLDRVCNLGQAGQIGPATPARRTATAPM